MPTLTSWTPPRNSTAARIQSSTFVARAPASRQDEDRKRAEAARRRDQRPAYVASLSGTSENETIASKARRKRAGYEAPRPLVASGAPVVDRHLLEADPGDHAAEEPAALVHRPDRLDHAARHEPEVACLALRRDARESGS